MPEFVRVRDKAGNRWSQSTATPIPPGCEVVDELAATNGGDPLPWKPKVNLISANVLALKGDEINAELDKAGLPKGGTVAERQQRLTDHQAALSADTTQEEQD
jgi:hypothetical protein